MIIKEFRISMPMTVAEYQVGQLYCVAETARTSTQGEEGIEILKNEPFDNVTLFDDYSSGQYTHKIYHFASKVPYVVRKVLPNKSMAVSEEAWNAYPYCKTVLTSSVLHTDTFCITIETIHLDDKGETENAHKLPPELLKNREVVYVDIANDPAEPGTLEGSTEDPRQFHSIKTGRGPLENDWKSSQTPIMTAYKLVKVQFRFFGLQTRIESWIQNAERELFLQFHRRLFGSIDQWCDMNLDDVRKMEDFVQEELKQRFRPPNAIE